MQGRKVPSMHRLRRLQWITDDDRLMIRELLHGTVSPNHFSNVREWLEACLSAPPWIEQVMLACDEVLGTHGVEAVNYKGKVIAEYCNTGDAYQATLIYRYRGDIFYVGSWADLVERRR